MDKYHVHFSLLAWLNAALDFLTFIIPLKLIAAHYVGKSQLANAAYSVL